MPVYFPPAVDLLQERASNSGPTGTSSHPCPLKAGPLPPSLSSHPVLSSWLLPRRPRPRPTIKPQNTGIGFQGPSSLPPPTPFPVCSRAPVPCLWVRPMATVLCCASTCRGIHLKPLSIVCLFEACRRAKGYDWTLHGFLQAMSIRPFTWKEAKLSLSNS